MSPQLFTLLIVIAVVAAVAVVWFVLRQKRSERLRRHFGPEYERAAREMGDVRRAEAALEARAKRVERLHIRPLTPEDRTRFSASWQDVQRRFVDDPEGAATEADRLVGEVMAARGYPIGDFEQRADDVSVDHPHVVWHYRAGREIAQRHARGEATTEDLRQAMVHYRALFDDLLGGTTEPAPEIRTAIEREREREVIRGKR
jgi:hypothetical protein